MNLVFIPVTICLLLLEALTPMTSGAKQKCNSSILASSAESEFLIHEEGTASDQTTGLMWMRCSLGQEWKGGACSGKAASYSWPEALKAAAQNDFAGYADWRLPNKNELASIVEERCVGPSINEKVFPATPSTFFWSSSPYAGLANGAWSVDFGYGVVTATEKIGKIHVRLVRNEE